MRTGSNMQRKLYLNLNTSLRARNDRCNLLTMRRLPRPDLIGTRNDVKNSFKQIPMACLLLIFFFFTLAGLPNAKAQQLQSFTIDSVLTLPDSAIAFSIDDLYTLVFTFHPVVKQANLLEEQAQQEIQWARGAFDPKLEADWNVKNFDNKEYYNIFNTTLKVPLWFPIDPKVSVDRNRGVFLNPESMIPDNTNNWQITAGVSLPLGRGLFIDDRRATVKQSVLFQDILAAEQVKIINKILLEATKDYWNWYFDYYNYRLLEQSIGIAQQIFDRVKLNYEYGEAAVIDTVQAQITLQNRMIEMQEARVNFIRSGLKLSNHLWGENEEPLELSDNAAPVMDDALLMIPSLSELQELRMLAEENHPEIRKLDAKTQQLAVENQLNRENLKPRLDVNYNLINAPISPDGETNPVIWDENYKFGFTFGFPLLLRKERAKVQLTNIKIQQNNYERNLKRREILNEIQAVYAELTNTFQIIQQQTLAVDNYRRLLEAELFNLENGESDLFKINFQQDKLIDSQSKLLKLRAAFEKSRATLYWAAGVENLNQ